MKAKEIMMLDRATIVQAFVKAIESVGLEQFKKTSLFGSNEASHVRKNESLAA